MNDRFRIRDSLEFVDKDKEGWTTKYSWLIYADRPSKLLPFYAPGTWFFVDVNRA